MKTIVRLVGMAGVFILTSCSVLSLIAEPPRQVTHPQPEFSVPWSARFTAGCRQNEYGTWMCPPESPPGQLGCSRIYPADDALGGLSPALPMAVCMPEPESAAELRRGDYFYNTGCTLPLVVWYLVEQDGELMVLRTPAAFQQVFAPVESAAEALSYAAAVSGRYPVYQFDLTRGWRYFVKRIETSHVTEIPEGYSVRLFDYQFCGCGPHATYAFDVTVTTAGDFSEGEPIKLFENPAEDDLCVD